MSDLKLPGFMTPESPNSKNRLSGSPQGEIKVQLASLDPNERVPSYVIYLTREFGGHYDTIEKFEDNAFVFSEIENGQQKVFFRLLPDDLELRPGTYTLRALIGYTEVGRFDITLPNHSSRYA